MALEICPYCLQQIRLARFVKHLRTEHGKVLSEKDKRVIWERVAHPKKPTRKHSEDKPQAPYNPEIQEPEEWREQ